VRDYAPPANSSEFLVLGDYYSYGKCSLTTFRIELKLVEINLFNKTKFSCLCPTKPFWQVIAYINFN